MTDVVAQQLAQRIELLRVRGLAVLQVRRRPPDFHVVGEYAHTAGSVGSTRWRGAGKHHVLLDAEMDRPVLPPEPQEPARRLLSSASPPAELESRLEGAVVIAGEPPEGFVPLQQTRTFPDLSQ